MRITLSAFVALLCLGACAGAEDPEDVSGYLDEVDPAGSGGDVSFGAGGQVVVAPGGAPTYGAGGSSSGGAALGAGGAAAGGQAPSAGGSGWGAGGGSSSGGSGTGGAADGAGGACAFPPFCPTGGTSGMGGAVPAGGAGGAVAETLPGFTPLPANPKECPAGAPANPVGLCLGLPIYVACNYTNGQRQYSCVCDWYHWLCI